jgi:hypothetical protein
MAPVYDDRRGDAGHDDRAATADLVADVPHVMTS